MAVDEKHKTSSASAAPRKRDEYTVACTSCKTMLKIVPQDPSMEHSVQCPTCSQRLVVRDFLQPI